MSAPRHFLDLDAIAGGELRRILDAAAAMKAKRAGAARGAPDADAPLNGHTLAMIFEKASTRTRLSFDMAIRQLGGQSIVLTAGDLQLGRGETIADTARVMSRYVDILMYRGKDHDDLAALAGASAVPVINGLTDFSHPCQIMGDILTIEERLGPVAERCIAWLGDGNNVATSWAHAAAPLEVTLRFACPGDYAPPQAVLRAAEEKGAAIEVTADPARAVTGADVVATDTWFSMGTDETDAERREKLSPYQVNDELMKKADEKAIFLHCLPARRGEEVTDSVIDGPQSAVWDEAENRLHAQKAILLWCLELL